MQNTQKLFFLKELTWVKKKKVTKGFLGRDNENNSYSSSHLPIHKKPHHSYQHPAWT